MIWLIILQTYFVRDYHNLEKLLERKYSREKIYIYKLQFAGFYIYLLVINPKVLVSFRIFLIIALFFFIIFALFLVNIVQFHGQNIL